MSMESERDIHGVLLHYIRRRIDLELVKDICNLIEARTVSLLDVIADIRTADEVILSVYEALELWCFHSVFCRESLSFNKNFKFYSKDLVAECQKQPASKKVIQEKMENVSNYLRKAAELADKIFNSCKKLINCKMGILYMELIEMNKQ